eukprot:3546252-Rhodomonas_salina.2
MFAMQCPVLVQARLLPRICYAKSGTDMDYAPNRWILQYANTPQTTRLYRYAPTSMLRDARY